MIRAGCFVRMLNTLGYKVLEAIDVNDAIALCRSRQEVIHLVLTDVVMPHMSGPKLIEELKRIRSDFKVLFTTGFTEDAVSQHGPLSPGTLVLPKPYTRDTLAYKIRQALDGSSPG